MRDSNFNDAQKQNLDDLFKTLNINSSSTPFPNASNMVSNDRGHTAFTQKDIRGGDNSYFTGGGAGSAYFDGLRNYMTDNRGGYGTGAGGGGMQDVSVQRGSGGTGGGSEDTVGNMDANQLLTLNPYLSKNVTSFNEGGMFGEFAKYNHGGTVGSVGSDGTKYSVDAYKKPAQTWGNDGGREENRINKIRAAEWKKANGLNPYHVQTVHGDTRADSPYMKSFKAEQDKRQNERWLEAIKTNNMNAHNTPFESLKNPWEEGYDNWYGQAENGMRMPKYNHGGNVGSMNVDNERPAGFNGGPGGYSGPGPYVAHQPGSSAYNAYVDQGVIPTGNTTFNPYTGQYSREVKQRYDNGGMMPQQQMPQQTESYAKQANDMIALAQLEAFGKKFLSQTQGQMPPEMAQAMNQQGIPQAANGMKRLYQQGGNYPHNMYNKETGYKIVAEEETAHTKLAGAGFDHTPKANQGMKMKNLSNREKLDNLLKSVPNKEAFNNLSKPDQDSFNNAWFKYGGARTQKRKFTSGGRF